MVYAVFSVFVLVLLITTSFSGALTRTINDSSDNIKTFITSSNGDYWTSTGANLKIAVESAVNGETITIPSGTFVTQFNISADGVTIRGQGHDSTILKRNHVGDNDNIYAVINIQGADYVLIENLQIDGDYINETITSGESVGDKGIRTWNSKYTTYRGIYAHGFLSSAISVHSSSSFITIENCITNGSYNWTNAWPGGITIAGDNCIVSNNYAYGPSPCGIIIEGSVGANGAENNIVTGNYVTGNISHGIHLEDDLSFNTTVSNNLVRKLQDQGIYGEGATGIVGVDAVISNNIVLDIPGYGIQGNFVEGNIVKNATTGGIYQYDNDLNDSVKFDGNKIYNCTRGILLTGASNKAVSNNEIYNSVNNAIYCSDANNVVVTGNYVFGSDNATIYISDYKMANINDNTIINTANSDEILYLRDNSAKDAGAIVSNNLIVDEFGATEGIYLRYSDNAVVSNNKINGNGNLGIGILSRASNSIYDSNFINGTTSYALHLDSGNNVSVIGNNMRGCGTAIQLGGNPDSIIQNNNVLGNTATIAGTLTDVIIKNNIGYNHNSLFPYYEQNTAPTINDNCTAYWYDLDDGYMYQIVNTYSTVYYVNMTTSI